MEEYREGLQIETTTNMVRALAQFAGLVLLVFGVAVSLHVLFKVMRIWEEPTRLKETMTQWEEVLETRLVIDADEKEWNVAEWSVQTEEGAINRRFNPAQYVTTEAACRLVGRTRLDIESDFSIKVLIFLPQF